MTIIRGTTPTLKFTFNTVDVSDITDAVLIVAQGGTTVIQMLKTAATVGADYIAWTIAQADSVKLDPDVPAKIQVNWKLNNGTRGASKAVYASIADNTFAGTM